MRYPESIRADVKLQASIKYLMIASKMGSGSSDRDTRLILSHAWTRTLTRKRLILPGVDSELVPQHYDEVIENAFTCPLSAV